MKEKEINALVKVYPADNLMDGISDLIKGYGFGPLEPNTIVLGESEEENLAHYARLIQLMHGNKRNVIIVKEGETGREKQRPGRIDVWWGQKGNNAGLILALAHLLSTSPAWPNSRLILKTVISSKEDATETEKGLRTFIEQGRIDAEVEIVPIKASGIFETIESHSRNADFVFIGLRPPDPEETPEAYTEYLKDIMDKTRDIPFMAYVMSSEDIEFKRIFSSL